MTRRVGLLSHRLLALVTVLFVTLSACDAPSSDGARSTTSGQLQRTLPTGAMSGPVAPLRLWTTSRAGLHPIRRPGTFQNKALDRLLYEPLVDYTRDGRLVGVVAETMSWVEGQPVLIFTLKKGKTFSDGTAVTASDVVASLNAFIDRERAALSLPTPAASMPTTAGTSPTPPAPVVPAVAHPSSDPSFGSRADVIQAITSVASDASGRIVVTFRTRYDNAPGLLRSPILPAAWARTVEAPVAPGTGPYRIEQVDGTHYRLHPKATGASTLDVVVMASVIEAMRSFQDGGLDLLLMSPDEYARYRGRQVFVTQGIPVGAFTYLRANRSHGLLARDAEWTRLGALLTWQHKLVAHASAPHWPTDLPAARDDARLPLAPMALDRTAAVAPPPPDTTLVVGHGSSTFDQELGGNLRLLFERLNYTTDVRTVAPTDPPPDLDLVTYTFEGYPDAYEFFQRADEGRDQGALTSVSGASDTLKAARRPLDTLDAKDLSRTDKTAYRAAIEATMKALPLVPLCIPEAGVAYSRRVEGRLESTFDAPYHNMEALHVWPTSSH